MDEAGRGPLFGRVYVAAVVLPKSDFRFDWMKDSKKIKSKKKMRELADYIKANAVAWSVRYAEADDIDKNGILNCVIREMHNCILTSPPVNHLQMDWHLLTATIFGH